jgi:hypothetical protein
MTRILSMVEVDSPVKRASIIPVDVQSSWQFQSRQSGSWDVVSMSVGF